MTTHPGIEGYGVLGSEGVVVERWRYARTVQEYLPPLPRVVQQQSYQVPTYAAQPFYAGRGGIGGGMGVFGGENCVGFA